MALRGDGRHNDTKAGLSLGQPETRNPYFLLYEPTAETELFFRLSAQGWFKVVSRKLSTPLGTETLANLQAAIDLLNYPPGDSRIGSEAEGRFYAVSFGDPGAASGGAGSRGGWTDWPKVPFVIDNASPNPNPPGTLIDDNDFATRINRLRGHSRGRHVHVCPRARRRRPDDDRQ